MNWVWPRKLSLSPEIKAQKRSGRYHLVTTASNSLFVTVIFSYSEALCKRLMKIDAIF